MANWLRIFPDSDHRWTMGMRPGYLNAYFAPQDASDTLLPERTELLAAEPEKYASVKPEGIAALRETVEFVRRIGVKIEAADDAAPAELLAALGSGWEPDVVWLRCGELGRGGEGDESHEALHRVVGGIVCFPSSWALAEKMGLPMSAVHAPVPGLNEALGRQVDRFLAKLAPGDFWTRENWSLSRSPARNQHTSLQLPGLDWPRLDGATPIAEVWIRLEHQILLRLPESEAVLFGIRIESPPLAALAADPIAAGRLARILETMSDDAARYKNILAVRPTLIAALRFAASR